jgi:gamma-glutamylputrescine oxidase
MLSYWEQQSFTRYHFIVIGAGIVGLSTAIELKQRFPATSVLVLERGLLPTGATTRNAGFACMGSATELLDDLGNRDEAAVTALFAQRKSGLEKLRARFGDQAIGYRADGGHELISERELYAIDKLDYLNRLLQPVLGFDAFTLKDEHTDLFGFNRKVVKTLIQNNSEGGLHSGMLMRALLDLSGQLGIEVKTGAHVTSFQEEEQTVRLSVENPHRSEALQLTADRLLICTNAFTRQLLPDVDVTPGRGQVLITEPIAGLRIKGVFHFDQGYYYFRELDGRILFGGGRNLDFQGEATTEIQLNEQIQADLDEQLRTLILPDTPFRVAQRWAGIMAFGNHKGPIVQAFSDRVYGAFRMGGMGVALGTEVAEQLVRLVANNR